MAIVGIDHVQLAMPAGREEDARAFYSSLLGLPEVPKPDDLAKRGGVWFESSEVRVHLGVDGEFRPAKKAHPAFLVKDLRPLVERLRAAGVVVTDDEPLAGYARVYVSDPFGNRLELMERRPSDETRHRGMTKSTVSYWNPLSPSNQGRWTPVTGLEGMVEEVTLSVDPTTGEYTRLTRFLPGANTSAFGGKSHDYPEEVFVVSGRLYDHAFDLWLEAGHYTSRPAGEVHGPFETDVGCVVLELSFPARAAE